MQGAPGGRRRSYDRVVPIYEFECTSCGARFEAIVAAGTDAVPCRECGAEGAQRRFSSFGVTARQLTPRQRRRLEDRRGTDRGGARERFQRSLDRARKARGGEGGKPPR